VVTFRVERDGGPPVPVELHGEVLRGSLSQGDTVEVPARFARGRPVDALTSLTAFGNFVTFWNLDTGEKVRVGYTMSTVIGITLGWCLLALLIVAVVLLLSGGTP
jgi:hypothetical protein